MIKRLYIQNYALINKLNLEFNEGLNVITGETGAGKSILIGALGLILGNRADISVVNKNGNKCIIEAVFNNNAKSIDSYLEQNDLDVESELHIRREITLAGKSRAFVNDTPVSLLILKSLARYLVDVNSQNQTFIFRNPEFQLAILDDLSNSKILLRDYVELYKKYRKAQTDLKVLRSKEEEAIQQKDFLQFQLDELVDAKLISGEEDDIQQQLEWMDNSENIKKVLYSATQYLSQGDEAINGRIELLLQQLASLSGLQLEYDNLQKRVDSVLIELQDVASEYERLFENTDFDPEEHSILQERNSIINHLLQKHRKNSVGELLNLKRSLEEQLLGIDSLADKILNLEQYIKELNSKLLKKALALSENRKKAINTIQKNIINSLQSLGMKDANFVIDINKSAIFKENGMDEVNFLFSSNKGHSPDLVSKIASGGEMSRLVLSLKSMYSANMKLPTVIFDEIDTGVSGDIASRVGGLMLKMATNMQLITITHLPQIAAKSNWHYKVYKAYFEGVTYSDIRLLNKEEQLEEIALMLSGDAKSKQALKMAKELKSINHS